MSEPPLTAREQLLIARAVSQAVDLMLAHGFATARTAEGDPDDLAFDLTYAGDRALRELRANAAALGAPPAKSA